MKKLPKDRLETKAKVKTLFNVRYRSKSTALDSICCCWKMGGVTSRIVGHLI